MPQPLYGTRNRHWWVPLASFMTREFKEETRVWVSLTATLVQRHILALPQNLGWKGESRKTAGDEIGLSESVQGSFLCLCLCRCLCYCLFVVIFLKGGIPRDCWDEIGLSGGEQGRLPEAYFSQQSTLMLIGVCVKLKVDPWKRARGGYHKGKLSSQIKSLSMNEKNIKEQ